MFVHFATLYWMGIECTLSTLLIAIAYCCLCHTNIFIYQNRAREKTLLENTCSLF